MIDLQALGVPAARGRGAGTGSRALANALLRHAPDYEVFLLRRDPPGWQVGIVPAGVKDVDTVWNTPACWSQTDPTAFMTTANIEVLYVTCPLIFGFEVPPTPPGVLVASQVHDLVPVVMADRYFNTWSPGLQADYRGQLQFLREADLLLGSSQATANDLTNDLKPRGLVRVAYLCASNEFNPMDQAQARALVANHLGITHPYVVAVTENDPRKNTTGLLAGFAAAALPDHQLVVAGMFNKNAHHIVTQMAKVHGMANQVVTLGFISKDLLNALYSGADLFVFPSLYEGFGVPSLEAMQSGVPVVAGNNSCFPEVVGEAGLLVDTSQPEALGAAIRQVVTDENLRETLIAQGLRQAARFSLQRTAAEITSAFAELKARGHAMPNLPLASTSPAQDAGRRAAKRRAKKARPILVPERPIYTWPR